MRLSNSLLNSLTQDYLDTFVAEINIIFPIKNNIGEAKWKKEELI